MRERVHMGLPGLVIAAAAFVALFILTVHLYRVFKADERRFVESASERLSSLPARDPASAHLRVVATGSSLIRRATFFDDKMSDFAARNRGARMEFVRVARSNGDITDLAPFFREVLDASPDVVLMEHESVFYTRRKKGFRNEYPPFLKALIKNLMKMRLVVPKEKANLLDASNDPLDPIRPERARRMLNDAVLSYRNRAMADFDEIEPFFREAREKGIRVVLVDIRRSPALEAAIGVDRSETAAALERLGRDYGVELIEPPGYAQEYYWDYAHLNEAGRELFSLWLVEALAGLQKAA